MFKVLTSNRNQNEQRKAVTVVVLGASTRYPTLPNPTRGFRALRLGLAAGDRFAPTCEVSHRTDSGISMVRGVQVKGFGFRVKALGFGQ